MGIKNSGSGAGIPTDAYIVSITNATQFVISAATTTGAKTNQECTIGNALNSNDGTKLLLGTTFHLIQTAGTFQSDDVLASSNSADFATSGTLGADPTYYTMADAHSVYGTNSQSRPYYADICPKDLKKLTGTASSVNGAATTAGAGETIYVLGTNTQFTSDLKIGDLIQMEDETGVTRRHEVRTIESNTRLTTLETFPKQCTNSIVTRVRSKVEEQEELVMISKLPKQAVKTLKPSELNNKITTILTVRRQKTLTLDGAGVGQFNLSEGESFIIPFVAGTDDYVVSVVTEASSNAKYPAGTVLYLKEGNTDKAKVTIGATSFNLNLANYKFNKII